MAKQKLIEEVFVLKTHIWEDSVNVVFTNSVMEAVKSQIKIHKLPKKSYMVDKSVNAVVLRIDEPQFNSINVVFNFNVTPDVIVHECIHLTFGILHKRGLKMSGKTEEAYAYTTQYLFREIMKFKKKIK